MKKPNVSPPFKPLVSTAERQRVFGKFEYSPRPDGSIKIHGDWANKNIIKVHIPQLEGIEGAPDNGAVYFHRLGAEQLKALFEEWDAEGLIDRVITWAGSFVPRMIRGSKTSLSNHAFGTAFDINAAWNGLGRTPTPVGKEGSVLELVEIAHKHGFYWGGNFSRKDGMHFELAKIMNSPLALTEPVKESAANPVDALADSGNSSSPVLQAQPAQANIEIKDGNIVASTTEGTPPEPETVVIEKPAPREFGKEIRNNITAVTGGELTLQAVRDYAEQAKFLGLSARFWLWISIIALVGGAVFIIVKLLKHRSDVQRDLEITNQLIAANSTATNQVVLASADELDKFKEKKGFKIVTR